MTVLGSYHLFKEFRQFYEVGFDLKRHFTSLFNIVEPVGYMSVIIIPVLFLLREQGVRELSAVASVVLLFNTFQHMRAFAAMGPLVRTVLLITARLREFVIILLTVVIGFSNAFYVLHYKGWYKSGKEPATPNSKHVTFLETMIMTFFSPDSMIDYDDPLACVLYVTYTFIATIVLMNMIIAMMTEIYEKIAQSFNSEFMRERANIIADYFDTDKKQQDSVRARFKWIYVLKAEQDSGSSSQEQKHILRKEANSFVAHVNSLKETVTKAI